MNPPGRFIRSGKVKDLYDIGEGKILFHFTDRVSAFDVVLPTSIPRKGEVLCKLSAFWFETLGVRNHMIRLEGPNMMVVKRVAIIPVECVVRGYLYGSLYDRLMKGEVDLQVDRVLASSLPAPYFDPTTKSEVKDEPITEDQITAAGTMSEFELRRLKESSISIYNMIAAAAHNAGFILADLKVEFGRDSSGEILLADAIGPDEFRLWPRDSYEPGKTQESYDKQPIRDWLTSAGYKQKLDDARKNELAIPPPPALPAELVKETSRRYVYAYEKLTGKKLG